MHLLIRYGETTQSGAFAQKKMSSCIPFDKNKGNNSNWQLYIKNWQLHPFDKSCFFFVKLFSVVFFFFFFFFIFNLCTKTCIKQINLSGKGAK